MYRTLLCAEYETNLEKKIIADSIQHITLTFFLVHLSKKGECLCVQKNLF